MIKIISLITSIIVNILAFTLYFNIVPSFKSELDSVQSELDSVQNELDSMQFHTITDTTTYYDLKLEPNQTRSVKLVAFNTVGNNVELYDENGNILETTYTIDKNDVLFITITYTDKVNIATMRVRSGSSAVSNQRNYESINNLYLRTPYGNMSLFIW